MQSPVIRVESLGKQYQIGALGRSTRTSARRSTGVMLSPLARLRRLAGRAHESERFWALKNLSFDVQVGEVVGIIGRNGAGKSTLLKILSQITEPTEGRVELIGRVGSLLEVGTGFHPDLTGRENVYLNGAILGMSRRDIARRFDEIVAFAEVEKFLDTQVKRYSSGMYMRLAFAVAAHLEPEILIIDEVLAVGDAAFQKKCLGKMSDVAHHGRTVLFVSHNMAAVQNLCTRCLLLEQGAIVADTDPATATAKYLENIYQAGGTPVHQRTDRRGSGQARLVDIRLLSSDGQPVSIVPMGSDWNLEFTYDCISEVPHPELRLFVTSSQGQRISRISSFNSQGELPSFGGRVKLNCCISQMNLLPGLYHLSVRIASQLGETIDYVESAQQIEVAAADRHGTGRVDDARHAPCYFPATWTVDRVESLSNGAGPQTVDPRDAVPS